MSARPRYHKSRFDLDVASAQFPHPVDQSSHLGRQKLAMSLLRLHKFNPSNVSDHFVRAQRWGPESSQHSIHFARTLQFIMGFPQFNRALWVGGKFLGVRSQPTRCRCSACIDHRQVSWAWGFNFFHGCLSSVMGGPQSPSGIFRVLRSFHYDCLPNSEPYN